MTIEQLKEKAMSLPLVPGVYLMRDKQDKVIYVGKAKKLKNRVSQYFQDTVSHSFKTRQMVSSVDHFEVIVAASEFEALVLECSLIKRHMPKYNILLKDDKGFPYVRMDKNSPYPRLSVASRIMNDDASYFGPFGSRGVTNSIIETIQSILKLPVCSKSFPRDIGKDRPCLHYHMGQCDGWCQANKTNEEYLLRIEQARQLLSGNYKIVLAEIKEQMLQASENLDFELAASLRDRLKSVEALGQKQLVTAGKSAETDVIGYAENESKACFAVLHFSEGNLVDKDFQIFSVPEDKFSAVSSLMKQYYLSRGAVPKYILLPFEVDDLRLFEQLLESEFGRRSYLKVPQRGDNVKLVDLANKNALEEAQRVTSREEKTSGAVKLLEKMLSISPLDRVESFDISNISGTDMVASMVVFERGAPQKGAYKKFKIKDMLEQDDYAAMEQVLARRFLNFKNQEKGFEKLPDLLLIDGGINHASVAEKIIAEMDINIPVFGMVKDDRHRTRALVTSDGREVRIDSQQAVFSLIGKIQEETHRFAISYHRKLRSKRLRYSELDGIPGIGPKRKQVLLKHFKSITAIASATKVELEQYLPVDAAEAVFTHFQLKKEV